MVLIGETIDAYLRAVHGEEATEHDYLLNCLAAEKTLRELFATTPDSPLLANPHVGLIDIFSTFESFASNPGYLNELRPRPNNEDPSFHEYTHNGHYLFPLVAPDTDGDAFVPNFTSFTQNWDLFTHGVLSKINWNNVIAAGGSVQACMLPLPDEIGELLEYKVFRQNTFYHETYPAADIDLFIWGVRNQSQAELMIGMIHLAIKQAVPWHAVCVRKANTISIHTLFPYRPVQIILRLYQSPAEILAGFDIDAACYAYDGTKVWTNPRGFAAFLNRSNTIDVSRRSPSYEIRLTKYARRGFRVHFPTFEREKIDKRYVYDRDLCRFPDGLARLLVLERMYESKYYYKYLVFMPGAPQSEGSGRLPLAEHQLDENNYDLVWTSVPYGIGWYSQNIAELIERIDEAMNRRLVEDGRGLHHHAVTATMSAFELFVTDCCQNCPEPSSLAQQEFDTNKYFAGPVKFITTNAGRQLLSGSFNPINTGDWCRDAYKNNAIIKPLLTVKVHERRRQLNRALLGVSLVESKEEATDVMDVDSREMARKRRRGENEAESMDEA